MSKLRLGMHGKVKITVIATGFDRADARLAAQPSQTPVDLQHYTAWRQDATYERVAARRDEARSAALSIRSNGYFAGSWPMS